MHPRRVDGQVVEQGLPGARLVALGVAGRQEPLVAPVELDVRPVDGVVRRALRQVLEQGGPDPAAREHQPGHPPGGLHVDEPRDEPGGRGGGEHVRVRVDDDVAAAHPWSPSAAGGFSGRSGAPFDAADVPARPVDDLADDDRPREICPIPTRASP